LVRAIEYRPIDLNTIDLNTTDRSAIDGTPSLETDGATIVSSS